MLFKNVRKGKQGKRVTMSKDALRILIKEIADQAPSISSESVIYCDMDGVVADFTTYTTNLLGHAFSDAYNELMKSFDFP